MKTTASNSRPPAVGPGHTPTRWSPTLLDFIAEIDRMIDAGKPSTHLWNYCVWNRKAVLREMVKFDMSVRKVLAHHELLPERVAANTEALLNDLHACNTHAAHEARIAALVGLAQRWDERADKAEKAGEISADEKNWSDAQSNMANATAYAQCAADIRAALASAQGGAS